MRGAGAVMSRRVVPAVVAGVALAAAAWVLGLGAPAVSDAQTLPVVSVEFDGAETEGTAATFTVSLSASSTTDVVVTYSTSDRTTDDAATAGDDYTAATSLTETIVAGETEAAISIPTADDEVDESDLETFTLILDSATGADVSATAGSATGAIEDNDEMPVLSIYGASGTEGDETRGFYLQLSHPSAENVVVLLNEPGGTAIVGEDFEAYTTLVTIAAGDVRTYFDVHFLQDSLDEPNETILVIIATVTPNATIHADDSRVTLTIFDDDPSPVVSFASTAVDVDEDNADDEVVLTLELTNPSSAAITVVYSTTAGTASAGSDFVEVDHDDPDGCGMDPEPCSVTFEPGDEAKTISISTVDDSVSEPDETFTVTLESVSVDNAGLSASLSNSAKSATVTIKDDDTPTVSFASTAVDVDENSSVVLTVQLSPASSSEVTVDYATAADSAESDDFTAASGTLTFAAGETSKTVTVVAEDDDVHEPFPDTFTVTLSNVSTGAALGADSVATVTIQDDEPVPSVSISPTTLSVTEGDPAGFTLVLSGLSESGNAANVRVRPGGSATQNGDYTSGELNSSVLIGPGTLESSEVALPTVADGIDELDESFTIEIYATSLNSSLGTNIALEVTIIDNDPEPLVSIADGTATEGAYITFTVSMDRESSRDVVVPYHTGDTSGFAAEADLDYVSVSAGSVTVPAGSTSVSLVVETLPDSLDENKERFVVFLQDPDLAGLGSQTAANGFIIDDDDPPELSIGDVSVVEGVAGGEAEVVVGLSAMSGKIIVVRYSVSAGTAASPADFSASLPFSFPVIAAGEASGVIRVPLVDDTSDEDDETFAVVLGTPSFASVKPGEGSATVTILDDDLPPELRIMDVTVDESLDAAMVVGLFDANGDPVVSGKTVTVGYSASDIAGVSDAAAAGADYVAPAADSMLTIEPGNMSGSFTVVVTNDSIDELDVERFEVALGTAVNATVDDGTAVVSITDDDLAPVVSVPATLSLSEGAGPAVFTVSLDAVSGLDVSVDYVAAQTNPGPTKATADDDFTVVSGSAVIAAGEMSTTVPVPVFDDTSDEFDETFQFSVANLLNAREGNPDTRATILDDDDPPELRIEGVTVGEGAGSAVLTVSLFDVNGVLVVSGKQVHAHFSAGSAAGDDASAGLDYTAFSSRNLAVVAGNLTGSLDVVVLDDTSDEFDETFTVTLTPLGGDNATVSATEGSAQVTITDDDAPPRLRIDDVQAGEGAGDVTFTVSLSDANDAPVVSGKPVMVDYSTVELTDDELETLLPGLAPRWAREHQARGDEDFTAVSPETLTIDANNDTTTFAAATFTVELLEDPLDEFDELFEVRLSVAVNATIDDGAALVTIDDNDALPELVVATVPVPVPESSGPVVFTLSLSVPSGRTVVVDYVTVNLTDDELETLTRLTGVEASEHGAVAGDDYAQSSDSVEFAPDAPALDVSVTVRGDSLDEYDELFGVALTPTHVTSVEKVHASIVDDDELPTISLTRAGQAIDALADEGRAEMSFPAELSPVSGRSASVHYATRALDAVAGQDFVAASERLVIGPGNTSGTVLVGIINDAAAEEGELLEVVISDPVNVVLWDRDDEPVPGGGSLVLRGTIFDDDGDALLSVEDVTVDENGGPAVFTVQVLDTLTEALAVDYSTNSSTAIAGEDFTEASGTITFNSTTTTHTISVPITADTVDEDDEQFSVAFIPQGATGRSTEAVATIIDASDPPQASIAAPREVTAREDTATVNFTVKLSTVSQRSVEVAYSTADGTATAGEDYRRVVDGSVTFAPGETSRTFAVQILDDEVAEVAETFTVSLAVVDVGTVTLGSQSTATVTITDNEGDPAVSITDATASEGAAVMRFEVALSASSSQPVSVDYATVDRTATAGEDYETATDTLTLDPGQTAATIEVQLLDDADIEQPETFEVTLDNPTNARVSLSAGTATGTIRDNDSTTTTTTTTTGGGGGGSAPAVEVEISGAAFAAAGTETAFSVSGAAGFETLTWAVTGPGGFSASGDGERFSFSPPAGGEYTVTVTATDRGGETLTATVTLAVLGDIAGSLFADEIVWLAQEGITTGCGDGTNYCPNRPVTRAEMATFLTRALNLETPPQPAGFADVDPNSVHAPSIEALHAAGITTGCGDGTNYCPNRPVTRAEMATFLTRALNLESPPQPAGFADVDPNSVHAPSIEALHAAGITTGCGDGTNYCPNRAVTRAQMAAFLHRARDLIATAHNTNSN